jgi:5-formyltetrahydrofolate cyclo-ligase
MSDNVVMNDMTCKATVRRMLRDRLNAISPADRHSHSVACCSWITRTTEFINARVVMIYLSTLAEVDTAPLALRCWQAGKTVVAPKVFWDQKRMLPLEISSLQTGMTRTGAGINEPISGKPVPTDMIDLVIVPGLGFTATGQRIGRGLGFYDRFLAQPDFIGRSCGLAFETQVLKELPVLDHDVPLSMLVTEQGVRRFAPSCIQHN